MLSAVWKVSLGWEPAGSVRPWPRRCPGLCLQWRLEMLFHGLLGYLDVISRYFTVIAGDFLTTNLTRVWGTWNIQMKHPGCSNCNKKHEEWTSCSTKGTNSGDVQTLFQVGRQTRRVLKLWIMENWKIYQNKRVSWQYEQRHSIIWKYLVWILFQTDILFFWNFQLCKTKKTFERSPKCQTHRKNDVMVLQRWRFRITWCAFQPEPPVICWECRAGGWPAAGITQPCWAAVVRELSSEAFLTWPSCRNFKIWVVEDQELTGLWYLFEQRYEWDNSDVTAYLVNHSSDRIHEMSRNTLCTAGKIPVKRIWFVRV